MNSSVVKYTKSWVEGIGASIIGQLNGLGVFTDFAMKNFYWMFKPPYRWPLLVEQLFYIGNKSIFITILTASFTGMVFAFQTYLGFKTINADSYIGPVVALSLAKELAPVLSGLIIAGRCGSAMAAQIGTMKVTEQVDALEVMGINSYQYLAVPRIIAGFFSLPMLSALFLLVGNMGAYLIGVKVIGIDPNIWLSKLGDFMHLEDVAEGLIKAAFFGYFISIIGTFHGFQVSGGAEGVGRGTNRAVVWGMVIVLIADFFLSSFLTKIL